MVIFISMHLNLLGLFLLEYDGVPISIVGNLTDSRSSLIQYQIPVGVMEDSTCEHYYINLTDYQQCKKFFDGMIEKCYETNTWKVEVWAVTKTNEEKNSGRKKRGLLQYISFRRKKGPNVHTRAVKSLPWKQRAQCEWVSWARTSFCRVMEWSTRLLLLEKEALSYGDRMDGSRMTVTDWHVM